MPRRDEIYDARDLILHLAIMVCSIATLLVRATGNLELDMFGKTLESLEDTFLNVEVRVTKESHFNSWGQYLILGRSKATQYKHQRSPLLVHGNV